MRCTSSFFRMKRYDFLVLVEKRTNVKHAPSNHSTYATYSVISIVFSIIQFIMLLALQRQFWSLHVKTFYGFQRYNVNKIIQLASLYEPDVSCVSDGTIILQKHNNCEREINCKINQFKHSLYDLTLADGTGKGVLQLYNSITRQSYQ